MRLSSQLVVKAGARRTVVPELGLEGGVSSLPPSGHWGSADSTADVGEKVTFKCVSAGACSAERSTRAMLPPRKHPAHPFPVGPILAPSLPALEPGRRERWAGLRLSSGFLEPRGQEPGATLAWHLQEDMGLC